MSGISNRTGSPFIDSSTRVLASRTELAPQKHPVGHYLDELVAVGAPVSMDEDLEDPEVGRDEFGDEPLVSVGGLTKCPVPVGAPVEGQVDGLVHMIRAGPRVGRVVGLSAAPATLCSELGGGETVELLGGRCRGIKGGHAAP